MLDAPATRRLRHQVKNCRIRAMHAPLPAPYLNIPRPVVVTTHDYAAGATFPSHVHGRGQFAFAACGAISVATPEGNWLVPPQRACWVPAGVPHAMTMRGAVTMVNTYIADDLALAAGLPARCAVFDVSPLLQALLATARGLPALYDEHHRDGKLMALLVAEMAAMPQLALNAPLPGEPRLARVCQRLFAAPSIAVGVDEMAAAAGMSRRTFTRLFRAQTGASFAAWRQQVCLLAAIERLSQGHTVTQVALDLGYASPSAFAAAFRQVLGTTPRLYMMGRRAG